VVSADRLIEELWGPEPTKTAPTALHGYVGQLRKLLGRERVVTQGAGYLLRIRDGELDADRFESLHEEHRIDEALALWRGPALDDCRDERFAQAEIGRLEALRVVALERRLEREVEGGRAAEAASELESLVREHPLRERLRLLLMLAYYRSGRQADALNAYQAARRALVDELGIEPSAELSELQRRILEQDPALAVRGELATTVAERSREERRTVSVVVCDVVDSTTLAERLDPERYRSTLERFVVACTEAFERHGGTVAEVSRDTVVGAFGLDQAHEDDALRALRATAELPAAVAPLGLEVRIGVATGELAVGGRSGALAGHAVNVAFGLRRAAAPGEIVFDEETQARCPDAVSARTVRLRVKGKAEPVAAYRLIRLLAGAPTFHRRFDTPLVGRERELADLRHAFDRAVDRRSVAVVTVLGAPGIGKTRLAREFAASLGDAAEVLVGHCLQYGVGVTYWPLREVVLEALRDSQADDVLAGDQDAASVRLALERTLGLAEGETSKQETFWAVRRLLESLADRRPLVVIVEDVQWAEDAFLELLEYVVDFVRDAPILLFCLARPEFGEERPHWLGRKPNSSSLLLEPLSDRESRGLVDHLAGEADPDLRARVTEAADGNPLFAEQLLAYALEHDGEIDTPPTLQALLAARIDSLSPGELEVAQAASVVGAEFSPAAVEELLSTEHGALLQPLAALVRRDLLRPSATVRGEDSFRFGHVLVRDAAYAAIPKRMRAEHHQRFAAWLASTEDAQDEIVGYHLERAHELLVEIGSGDDETLDLGSRAAETLGLAGGRAYRRGDFVGAASLFARALALISDDDRRRPELLIGYGKTLVWVTRVPEAHDAFGDAVACARRLGEPRVGTRASLQLLTTRMAGEEFDPDEAERQAREAVSVFEVAGDHLGAYEAWLVVHSALYYRGQWGDALEAVQHAIPHGRICNAIEARVESRPMFLHLHGPSPSSLGLACAEELLARADLDAASRADALAYSGVLLAMRGDPDRGRELVASSMRLWLEAGTIATAWLGELSCVEMLSGNWEAAARSLRDQCATLDQPGRGHVFATYAAMLATTLYELGEDDEALEWAAQSAASSPSFDDATQAEWRAARAKVLARAGSTDDAVALAREAVELVDRTDALWMRANTHLDLGRVLASAGHRDEAAQAIEDALRDYQSKEHLVGLARARGLLERRAVKASA
jgi:DNA-binding SARP family transcriptional activator